MADPDEESTPLGDTPDGFDADADPDDAGTDGTEAGNSSAPPEPDAAYKGLQRVLEKEKTRTRELEAKLQQAQTQPQTGATPQMVVGLLQEIAIKDPDRAAMLARDYAQQLLVQENSALKGEKAAQEQERVLAEAEQRNLTELRGIAADLGANPESPLIDYGAAGEWIADRIAKVRASVKEATRVPDRTNTASSRPAGDGTTHNTQPGSAPAPRAANGAVSDEALKKAQSDYAYHPTAENRAKLQGLQERYTKQLFG